MNRAKYIRQKSFMNQSGSHNDVLKQSYIKHPNVAGVLNTFQTNNAQWVQKLENPC